jgi:hypothetical protein
MPDSQPLGAPPGPIPAAWIALADPADWPLVEPPHLVALLRSALETVRPRIAACQAQQLRAFHRNLEQPLFRWPRAGSPRFDRILLVGQPRSGSAMMTGLLRFAGIAPRHVRSLLQEALAAAMIAPFGDPFWFDLTPYVLPAGTLSSTHAPPSPRLVEFLRQRPQTAVVLTVRDPRDAIVSFARMVANAGWILPDFAGGAAPAVAQRLAITGRLFSQAPLPVQGDGSRQVFLVPSYLNWLRSALLLAELPNAVVLRYEESFDQSDGRALFERLRREQVVAVEWRDFEPAFQRCMIFRNASGREPGQIDAKAHLARGQVGAWRDEWAADPGLLDHPVVQAFCARFGYPPP